MVAVLEMSAPTLNRRAFLKGLLGVAAGAVVPLHLVEAVEALAPVVALPGEKVTHTVCMWVKATTATTIDANGILVSVGGKPGWQRVSIPLKWDGKGNLNISWGNSRLGQLSLETHG